MRQNITSQGSIAKSIAMGMLVGISVALIFSAGFFFRDLTGFEVSAQESDNVTTGYPLLDEVQQLIDQHFLREQPTYSERQYAAIRGMLASLEDRYTFFVDPPVAQSESDVLAGTYGGIGVIIQRSEAGEFVLYPYRNSPAAAAGVQDGDILRAVNGAEVDLAEQQDVIDQMLRGEVKESSGVELTAEHAESGEIYTQFIAFAVIDVPSVVWRVLAEDSNLGYIQIQRFTSRTPDELRESIGELRSEGISGVVLDLRNNSGGLLQESVEVASQFVDGGVVLYERELDGEKTFTALPNGYLTDLPIVVLVNQGTASAAELVAGAIRDRERGILIGQRTYGKGTVQQIFRLSDQSSLHITSSEWFTPSRYPLDGNGLEPDIAMIPDENGRDVELGEAVRQLQQGFA